jgi:hypothetical protein
MYKTCLKYRNTMICKDILMIGNVAMTRRKSLCGQHIGVTQIYSYGLMAKSLRHAKN